MWHRLVSLASGEFMLRHKTNGGSIILARSLLTSLLVYGLCVLVREALAPNKLWEFSVDAARQALYDTLPWLGAIFAAVYVTYYSRFASQWNYLAGLYNQIKATEAQVKLSDDQERASLVLAEWKAGFIEDADTLHLTEKPLFAGVIAAWLSDPLVQYSLKNHSAGGEQLLNRLRPPLQMPAQNPASPRQP